MGKSIVSEGCYCYFCGKPKESEHHLIFGISQRKLAEIDGIKVPICEDCHTRGNIKNKIHDNVMAEKLSKMLGQALWELDAVSNGISKDEARKKFRSRYGKSYL